MQYVNEYNLALSSSKDSSVRSCEMRQKYLKMVFMVNANAIDKFTNYNAIICLSNSDPIHTLDSVSHLDLI